MIKLDVCYENGRVQHITSALPLLIGRDAAAGLCLRGWRVARKHARIELKGSSLQMEDFGSLTGTILNGRRIGPQATLQQGDQFIIGPCLIKVLDFGPGVHQVEQKKDIRPNECFPAPEAIQAMTVRQELVLGRGATTLSEPQADISDSAGHSTPPGSASVPKTPVISAELAYVNTAESFQMSSSLTLQKAALLQRRRLHRALLDALDLRRRDISGLSDTALREEAHQIVARLVNEESVGSSQTARLQLIKEVVDEAVGLGPLESMLSDPDISEIMVNRHDEIFVERQGQIQRHQAVFSSEQAVLAVIDRIVSPLGRRVDESSPMVDARLKDGSRVNAVIPPIALRGVSVTIRKFPERRLSMDDLLQVAALSEPMSRFLQACVQLRRNILVSGGTGSGKTTLLNVLSNCIPGGERIVTIEDSAELKLGHGHLVTLEARPANLEGRGKIEIRDLVRNALRMRPDRIVVGECRGAEAFDMLAAMNTGHEGSLTTLHANTARDALFRLETMILMAGMDLPLTAVREHIAGSNDLVVQQARLSSGRRLITSIVEVTGIESGRIQMQPLFEFLPQTPPVFRGCGLMPECCDIADLKKAGVTADMFSTAISAELGQHTSFSTSGIPRPDTPS